MASVREDSSRLTQDPNADPSHLARWAARLIVRLRWLVLAFWMAAAVGAYVYLPTIQETQTSGLGDLVPTESETVEAELKSARLFGFPLFSRTLVVQREPDGLEALEQARVVFRASGINTGQYPGHTETLGAVPIVNSLGAPPFSRERSTTAITYLFFPPDVGPRARTAEARRFVERQIDPQFDGFVGVTGTLAARTKVGDVIVESLPTVTLVTIVLVALAVALHFRAVVAPLVNLAAVGIGFAVASRSMAWLGERLGVSIPQEIEPVIVVLLFGIVTDYSIFFLSRFRRRVADGDGGRAAAERSSADLLPIIVTAGLTVIGASAALLVAELGFFKAFGPGMAIAVLVGLVVAITLVPALMAILGQALFWPSRPGSDVGASAAAEEKREEGRTRRTRNRALELASRRPVATAVACTLVLLAAASGLIGLEVGNPLVRGLPDEAKAKQAYAQATEGFAPGILSPTVLVVSNEGIVRRRAALARLGRLLERQPGVAEVIGPGDQPFRGAFGAVLSRTGDAARYVIVFEPNPLGAGAISALNRIERRIAGLLVIAGLPALEVQASFGGDTALIAETVKKTRSDLARIAPTAAVIVFMILAIFLRALVAPLYLVAASLLALAAALGLTRYLFQDVLGYGELTYYVPFAAAVLLGALGSDYNVFLTGRIWQEARRRPVQEAVAVGGARAATPIAVAGIVLALSFAALAIVPLRPFRELAFAMTVGLLLDAFLVRTLLVPALISIVGERSGWPGRRLRAKPPPTDDQEVATGVECSPGSPEPGRAAPRDGEAPPERADRSAGRPPPRPDPQRP
jgi:RND superfamily putative drug exporter